MPNGLGRSPGQAGCKSVPVTNKQAEEAAEEAAARARLRRRGGGRRTEEEQQEPTRGLRLATRSITHNCRSRRVITRGARTRADAPPSCDDARGPLDSTAAGDEDEDSEDVSKTRGGLRRGALPAAGGRRAASTRAPPPGGRRAAVRSGPAAARGEAARGGRALGRARGEHGRWGPLGAEARVNTGLRPKH
ncbi:unnamed protein product [Prorocentrum cordatum]|uniref:Uncharacterized protein n=1 Tax=Prorocentrum cordatum TaxID=2364126 RepID=A0ABN9QUY7_9DINO|nr:unnamed protein product [Polarella glacialis]